MRAKKAFMEIYGQTLKHLEEDLLLYPELEHWFPHEQYAPVVAFGFPEDDQEIPVLTVGLNPSNLEFPNFLDLNKNSEEQYEQQKNYFQDPYKKWFDLAEQALNGIGESYGGIYSKKQSAVHIDFSAHASEGGFDTLYSKANSELKRRGRFFIAEEMKRFFLPLVQYFSKYHNTQKIIVFGLIPSSLAGNATLKDASKDAHIFAPGKIDFEDHGIKAGWGGFHPIISRDYNLGNVEILFLSKGPSSKRMGLKGEDLFSITEQAHELKKKAS